MYSLRPYVKTYLEKLRSEIAHCHNHAAVVPVMLSERKGCSGNKLGMIDVFPPA